MEKAAPASHPLPAAILVTGSQHSGLLGTDPKVSHYKYEVLRHFITLVNFLNVILIHGLLRILAPAHFYFMSVNALFKKIYPKINHLFSNYN